MLLARGDLQDLSSTSAESPGAVPAPVPSEPLPGGIETILLAEDEAGVRNLAKESLELAGYTVITATGGQEALQLAATYPDDIDLLVTDVVMPQMSGRQLATLLTATRPTLKVLYMSGYTDDVIVEHAVLEPGLAFLNKPFGPAALVRRVRQVLDSPSTSPSPAERPRLSVPSA
ncbi:MAG: response regulator [Chloroflexi bacterium]|nr:response regulator [Chloroflexota bacterium]